MKCKQCDFTAKKNWIMFVHVRKNHPKQLMEDVILAYKKSQVTPERRKKNAD